MSSNLLQQDGGILLQEDLGALLLDPGLEISISGYDKTKSIVYDTLKIESVMTNRRDTARFVVRTHTGDDYVPRIGAEVIIYSGADKLFGGVITGIESMPRSFGIVDHSIECQDYTRLLDHRLVPDAFENKTVDFIIDYLKTNYFPAGFTINNVDAPITIKYVSFNYRPLSKCIEDLAHALNYDWYVDYDKDLHFFAKETRTAPFDLEDDNGKYLYDSLIIRRDNSQIRNSIIVRGGEYLGSQLTVDLQTNGVDFMFPLPYRFSDFAAHLTGEILSVGTDNLDQPDDYDALYNFQEKILRFKAADTPSSGKTLKVSGKPYLPVIVRYRSPEAITSMMSAEGGDGIYEYLIEDKSISTKEGARQRAQAEILAYAETLSEAEFITEESGLEVGQAISVSSASRGIDETFIINKISITSRTQDAFYYKVSLITTRTNDLIDVLQRLLLDSTKKIEIDPNEVGDIIFEFAEAIAAVDTLGTFSTHGGEYVYGGAKWGQATWS